MVLKLSTRMFTAKSTTVISNTTDVVFYKVPFNFTTFCGTEKVAWNDTF